MVNNEHHVLSGSSAGSGSDTLYVPSKRGYASSASCPSCKKQLPDESDHLSGLSFLDRDTTTCNACRAIFQAAAELYQRVKGIPGRPYFTSNPKTKWGIRAIEFSGTFCANLNVPEDCPDEDLQAALGVSKDRDSIGQTVRTCRTWLKHCISDHPNCQPWSMMYFPLRVLDLSQVGTKSLVFLIDHLSQEHAVPAQYACLSHCWGDSQPVKTTKDNQMQHMREGILLQSLPPTFRDAVTVTRALGINYLWIDSLCIIQGDEHDWQTQASEMAAIYGSSAISIAATSAEDCQKGFLDELHQVRQQSAFHYGTKPSQSIIATDVQSHAPWQFGAIHDIAEKLPLQRRAWTLQEHILPPRTLSFGNGEAVWACQSEMDCECGEIIIEASRFLDVHGKMNLKKWFSKTAAELGKKSDLDKFWTSLVSMYANRMLSHESDRLVALQGIVELVRRKTNLTPCYGHWDDKLVETLRWVGLTKMCSVPAVWRAPTWSWLSLEYQPGAFSYNSRLIDLHSPFTAETLAIKGLSTSESITSSQAEEWDNCPAGTLWLRAWTGDGVLRAGELGDEPSGRLVIPCLGRSPDLGFEAEVHTDAFNSQDIGVKCIILATGLSHVEMIICRPRGAGKPVARIGSCQFRDQDEEFRFGLFEHYVHEAVTIW